MMASTSLVRLFGVWLQNAQGVIASMRPVCAQAKQSLAKTNQRKTAGPAARSWCGGQQR